MLTYLERYIQGEHEQVWAELYAQGDSIYKEPLINDALAVTRETMKRVRHNVDLLIERLNALGYIFGVYPKHHNKINGYLRPHNLPAHDIAIKIAKYEALEGIRSFPMSLRIFWEIVGDVDFTGYYPTWPHYSDPLVIFPIETIEADYPRWLYQIEERDVETGKYEISISPDYYHKDNLSGGEPYRIRVPNYAIDGIVENEGHETTFVNYLRVCFRYAGFPGLQLYSKTIPLEISSLIDGLMQI